MKVYELYQALSERIPSAMSLEWDHDGLAICPDRQALVTGVLVALDATPEVISEAKAKGCNIILTHHPFLFRPIGAVSGNTPQERAVIDCLLSGISVMGFHTRADSINGGTNTTLIEALGLTLLPTVEEGVPYRMGECKQPTSADEFAHMIKDALNLQGLRYTDGGKPIQKVLVCAGGGRDFLKLATELCADAFVTGELGHHTLLDGAAMGMSLFEAGHYETEVIFLPFLARCVSEVDAICTPTTSIKTL